MTLTLRDPAAIEMARELASLRGVTEAEAVAAALAAALERERERAEVRERLLAIGARARAEAGPNARAVSKGDIDALWGQ